MTPRTALGSIAAPERLNIQHDLSEFDCGEPVIDDWLRNQAHSVEGRTARTYVVTEGGRRVVGYYAIATGSVERVQLPKKAQRRTPDPVPIGIVARLGVTRPWRGRGLGSDLLKDALKRLVSASEIVGLRGVLVHALTDRAVDFYRDHQFQSSPIDERTLFLPIETIVASL